MSSLKGQLSNVEGSVKSMKAAVVVGSVLTVACLAAVFGVTILANEVSKEVKVSNNTLTTKSGAAVLTQTIRFTNKLEANSHLVEVNMEGGLTQAAINARVYDNAVDTIICDDLMIVRENGQVAVNVKDGSILSSVLAGEAVESRNMNVLPVVVAWVAKAIVSCGIRRACRIAVRMAVYEAGNYLGSFIPDPPQ
ncbi:hypothetical protein HKI87_09g58790 [Chloropicon roscoffensis]|uniref:Uncharacterized protein n=1 Tax=Chloropicon roscoffensis TaxID=1461544 RepID=A0AAX4PDS7_9CHLO